jgi:hypothetical protein
MFIDKDFRQNRPLPSDITLRNPVYRREGIIAALIAGLATVRAKWQEAREISRLVNATRDLPDYIREDIGLPPAPPQPWLGGDPLRW